MPEEEDPFALMKDLLVTAGRQYGMVEVARQLCLREGSLLVRRKVALLVGGLLGHTVEGAAFHEKSEGFDAQCEACGMILKVPREISPGTPGVQGRATEFECQVGKGRT